MDKVNLITLAGVVFIMSLLWSWISDTGPFGAVLLFFGGFASLYIVLNPRKILRMIGRFVAKITSKRLG